MSKRLRNASRQFAAAVMLAAVLAGVACIATSGLTNGPKFATTSVDRMHKGDRLPQATKLQRPQISSNFKKVSPPTKVPPGCDPAFSPVADPEHGRIFGRCVT